MRTLRRSSPTQIVTLFLVALALFAASLFVSILRPSFGRSADTTPSRPQVESTADLIERYQMILRDAPDNHQIYAELGLAYLQQARESADPTLYDRAEQAFESALAGDPTLGHALIGQGTLALSRHEFDLAEAWALAGREANPYAAEPLAILVDAQVETGRYDEAAHTLQQLLDLRPDNAAWSRVSYLRELHGDVPGAIEAMERAASSAAPGSEPRAWSLVQVGHLYFGSGDLPAAERAYGEAIFHRSDFAAAAYGLARVEAARGDPAAAAARMEPVVTRLPLPEYAIFLGELYESMGEAAAAGEQYDLVRALMALSAAGGMNVDLELALFDAAHGSDPDAAVARAEAAYAARPSIHAADALAWSLLAAGDAAAARPLSEQALRLGTRDANLWYRAGRIALAAGDEATGRRYLTTALEINPHFSPLYAPDAQRRLAVTAP